MNQNECSEPIDCCEGRCKYMQSRLCKGVHHVQKTYGHSDSGYPIFSPLQTYCTLTEEKEITWFSGEVHPGDAQEALAPRGSFSPLDGKFFNLVMKEHLRSSQTKHMVSDTVCSKINDSK